MNILLFKLVLFLAFSVPALAAPPESFLRVEATIGGKASYKGVKGSSTRTKTQSRILDIEVSNMGREDVAGIKVVWTIFGHTMKDHKLIELKRGEKTIIVPARDAVEIASPEVKVSGTRRHTVSERKGRGKKARVRSKKVPASGEEYYGYAVELYAGGKLVASTYSKPGLEKVLHPAK